MLENYFCMIRTNEVESGCVIFCLLVQNYIAIAFLQNCLLLNLRRSIFTFDLIFNLVTFSLEINLCGGILIFIYP